MRQEDHVSIDQIDHIDHIDHMREQERGQERQYSRNSRGSRSMHDPHSPRASHGSHLQERKHLTVRSFFVGLIVALCCALVGWMFTVNVRANGSSRSSGNTAGLVRSREEQIRQLQKQVDSLSSRIDALRRAENRGVGAQHASQSGSGVTGGPGVGGANDPSEQNVLPAYKGPGVAVTLSDSPLWASAQQSGVALSDTNVNDYVVHQQDLEGVVNALWAGGAEAMTIQGVRVQSTTAVRCIGNVLLLQGRQYAPPYVIRAIGPVDSLIAALDASPSVKIYRQYAEAIQLGYKVERVTQFAFDRTPVSPRTLKYATRMKGSGTPSGK
jgi:uncharacterized protein YlxW (UPF0749 family)